MANTVADAASGFLPVIGSSMFWVMGILLITALIGLGVFLYMKGYIGVKFPIRVTIFDEVGGGLIVAHDWIRYVKETDGKRFFQFKSDKEMIQSKSFDSLYPNTVGKKELFLVRKNIGEYYPIQYDDNSQSIKPVLSGDVVNEFIERTHRNITRYTKQNQLIVMLPLLATFIFALSIGIILFMVLGKFEALSQVAGSLDNVAAKMLEIAKIQAANAPVDPNRPPF